MTRMLKRISKRRYDEKKCKQCGGSFIPTDGRQVFCTRQHGVDYNNDLRKTRAVPLKKLIRRLIHNEAVLRKIFTSIQDQNLQQSFSMDLLRYEQFDFEISHERGRNPTTNNEVEWYFYFGLETDVEKKRFTVQKRNYI
jgi:hypothetical protein